MNIVEKNIVDTFGIVVVRLDTYFVVFRKWVGKRVGIVVVERMVVG